MCQYGTSEGACLPARQGFIKMILFNQDQQQEWDQAVSKSADGGLLQSWGWGQFQEALGNAVYNISDDNKEWFAQCLQLRAGGQWILSIPRGPVFVGSNPGRESFNSFLKELKSFAKQRNCFLVRLDPAWETKNKKIASLVTQSATLKPSRKFLQPVHTLIVDTSVSEEELLGQMKSKWRYNINLAHKHEVKTRWGKTKEDAKQFFALVEKTTSRQDFASYDQAYFETLIEVLGPKNQAKFLFAEEKGVVIAALLICSFADFSIYLHGASDHAYRKVMAPHLLQWEAIKNAKSQNQNYDFWGVATNPPSNKQEEHWGGVTRFKKGFAPKTELTEYVGAYEIPVKLLLYFAYRLRSFLKN